MTVKIISQSIESRELATKQDIQYEIEKLRSELLKWTVGVGASTVILIGGMIAKGFHWF